MKLSVLFLGENPRLKLALKGIEYERIDWREDLRNRRLIICAAVGAFGVFPVFNEFIRRIRQDPHSMDGCIAGVVIDGESEFYTKCAAQEIMFAASFAGCMFPGYPFVEATGSLNNFRSQAKREGKSMIEVYFSRVIGLTELINNFKPPKFKKPRVLMIHASNKDKSNSFAIGRELCKYLEESCEVNEVALHNGKNQDCNGCGYEQCLSFAKENKCLYNDMITKKILPAICNNDILLFLIPNYNDKIGANLTALINRLTSLSVCNKLNNKYIAGVIVSGYSGGDIVGKQLLGAMCLNKGCILPPRFAIFQTANFPGEAMETDGIEESIREFAEHIKATSILY